MIGDVDAWWAANCERVVSGHQDACEQEERSVLP